MDYPRVRMDIYLDGRTGGIPVEYLHAGMHRSILPLWISCYLYNGICSSTETPLTFAEIIEAARMYNETAIGLWTASAGQTKLGNLPSEVITLHPGDKVVTFASDFMVTRA